MRRLTSLTIMALAAGLLMACPSDDYKDPPTGRDAGTDAVVEDAETPVDVADLPDRIINEEGPDITINVPQPLSVLSGNQAQVTATVTDEDGVDVSSVKAVIPGGAVFTLSRSGTVDDQYSGIIDISEIPTAESVYIFVEATDLVGQVNSAEVEVKRDRGPTVTFTSPVDGERYAGSVNLSFRVSDPNGVLETSVRAEVGGVPLVIANQYEDPAHGATPHFIDFSGVIVFNDPAFNPPLQATHQVIVTAENIANNVSSESTVTFVVDDEGPTINVLSPSLNEIVGGIINIEAEVTDPAGVLNTSVVAVIGGNADTWQVQLEPVGGIFTGSFDTTQLPTNIVAPSISVRAADQLSNESELGLLVALDNTSPVVSLDPPDTMRLAEEDMGVIKCSRQFDPVGDANPNDGQTVPQVHYMRARIEDRGNQAVGLLYAPLSLVNYATPRVYWLADTTQALVVDTDGDGLCDEINEQLIPSTNPQGANEVLALYLDPVDPGGQADFRSSSNLPASCDVPGEELEPPEPLCAGTRAEGMSVAIFYTVDTSEPAIWSIPQVDTSSEVYCTGHPFDNLGSSIPEGWVCVAARAEDAAGNIGVSKPIRICVDYLLDGSPSTCAVPADMPDCTGTWDSQTQTVDTSNPCTFDPYSQQFRDNEVLLLP